MVEREHIDGHQDDQTLDEHLKRFEKLLLAQKAQVKVVSLAHIAQYVLEFAQEFTFRYVHARFFDLVVQDFLDLLQVVDLHARYVQIGIELARFDHFFDEILVEIVQIQGLRGRLAQVDCVYQAEQSTIVANELATLVRLFVSTQRLATRS